MSETISLLKLTAKSKFAKFMVAIAFIVGNYDAVAMSETQIEGAQDFITAILGSIPASISWVLGVIYGIVIIVVKISDGNKHIQLNKIEIKKAKEDLEQAEIKTDKDRKSLEKPNYQ